MIERPAATVARAVERMAVPDTDSSPIDATAEFTKAFTAADLNFAAVFARCSALVINAEASLCAATISSDAARTCSFSATTFRAATRTLSGASPALETLPALLPWSASMRDLPTCPAASPADSRSFWLINPKSRESDTPARSIPSALVPSPSLKPSALNAESENADAWTPEFHPEASSVSKASFSAAAKSCLACK